MIKWAAFLMIFAGIGTLLYPFIHREVSSYQENQLLQRWERLQDEETDTLEMQEVPDWQAAQENYANLTGIFDSGRTLEKNKRKKNAKSVQPGDLLGVIEIDKIDCRLPILEGATLDHMRIAAGHITGTALPGAIGNSAIAAHRSYTYGRMFNRLNEVEVGDKVVIETRRKSYVYTVYKKLFVEPDDVSVLKGNRNERILTLITCHPMRNPTGRLIIKATVTSGKEGTVNIGHNKKG